MVVFQCDCRAEVWLPKEIVGESRALNQVLASAKQLALRTDAVLLAGERGSGKELLARVIHRVGPRRNERFVKIDCVTIPPELLERELFGFEKGAFDGAIRGKAGQLELADKGTLFLDEIAHIPLDLQSKLLPVLKRGEFERLGGTRIIRVNVCWIAATRHDPEKIAGDRLQQTLYNQFHGASIQIPPLRQRREDIPVLAHYFMRKFARRMNKTIETIAPETMDALRNYPWPGNVRQLENFIQRSVALTGGSGLHAPLDEL
jgi:formate hydrogenlyase transcriptional activator